MYRSLTLVTCLFLAPAASGLAADLTLPSEAGVATPTLSTQSAGGPALVLTLRGGIASAPEYIGADDYTAAPDLGFRLNSVNIGRLRFGDPDPWATAQGFGLRGSFRAIAERDSDDFDELDGLDDIDAAFELGLGVGYTAQSFAVFADVRRGFGGHEAVVGEIGADAIFRPTDRLEVTFGPRVFFGGDDYVDTYFGVDADEASAENPAYDPDAGMTRSGVELGMSYRFDDNWGLEGAVSYDRFRNDAADSPIVENGSDEQWGARLGITRTFRIGG